MGRLKERTLERKRLETLRPKRSRKGVAKAGKPVELSGAQDLYAFLYKACDIIRGPVSHENFKDYT